MFGIVQLYCSSLLLLLVGSKACCLAVAAAFRFASSAGLRVLIYSGDHDMCVPHTGSEAWTQGLGLKVQQPWRPWKFNDQVSLPLTVSFVKCFLCEGMMNETFCLFVQLLHGSAIRMPCLLANSHCNVHIARVTACRQMVCLVNGVWNAMIFCLLSVS